MYENEESKVNATARSFKMELQTMKRIRARAQFFLEFFFVHYSV